MDIASNAKNLHPLEIRLLRNFGKDEVISVDDVINKLDYILGQANQAFSWLSAKEFLTEVSRSTEVVYELTDLGAQQTKEGTPEERIITLLKEKGAHTMPEIAQVLGLENKDVGSAFGQLSKLGVFSMGEGKKVSLADESKAVSVLAVRAILNKVVDGKLAESDLSDEDKKYIGPISKKRGASSVAFKVAEHERVSYKISGDGLKMKDYLEKEGITGEELGALTQEMLSTGSWKDQTFRQYNVNMAPSRVLLGRTNPYCDYLRSVKDKLTSLGFEEFDGPLVETEFWNCDALFMPQFHSARDIHDVYHVKVPTQAKEIEQPYLDNVASAHSDGAGTDSRGWGYTFDREFTKRLILRSQGTVLSAKQLPKAKIPGKYFGVARCFRYDQVDATHLSDFYQTEGIVVGDDVNLRNLLGLLKMFAEEIAGATEVKYVPGYFPFTEPSVEVHIKHPVLGWFELGGAGIFRPEVTKPLGIDVPVLAWGLGIDRMALMHLGLNDLRELFSNNIENVRLRRRK